jgi:hypothetical protein
MAVAELSIDEMRAALSDQRILSAIGADESMLAATSLPALLQAAVKRETKQSAEKRNLQETLAQFEIEDVSVPPAVFADAIKNFINAAKGAYRQIGTTAASIANGEARALAHNMLGPLNFSGNINENILGKSSRIRIYEAENNASTRTLLLENHIDDLKDALAFLAKEVHMVKTSMKGETERFVKILNSAIVPDKTPAQEYVARTEAYLGVLAESDQLDSAITSLNTAIENIPTHAKPGDRSWAFNTVNGLCSFGRYLCNFAAAEADMLALEGIQGTRGPMQKAAIQMLRHVIVIDQKLYPANNQIPIPPPSGRLPDLDGFFNAYAGRQEMLATADEKKMNAINAKFDREINVANQRFLMLNEARYTYKPYLPDFVMERMDERGTLPPARVLDETTKVTPITPMGGGPSRLEIVKD